MSYAVKSSRRGDRSVRSVNGSGTYLKTKMTREELIELLEWILKDDKFGFGENWHEADEPIGEEEKAGWIIQATINYLKTHICVGN